MKLAQMLSRVTLAKAVKEQGGRVRPVKHFLLPVIGILLIAVLPLTALGQDKPNFFAGKAGLYVFTGDLEDAGHGEGFNGEIAYGYYLHPNFAVEGGTGYFHDGVSGETIYGEYLSC